MMGQEGTLTLWVLGGPRGESIVVETPGGAYGVIDAYQDAELNPTLRLLQSLAVPRLEFVAVTHPHLDHFGGLARLLGEYEGRVGRVWLPGADGLELAWKVQQELDEIRALDEEGSAAGRPEIKSTRRTARYRYSLWLARAAPILSKGKPAEQIGPENVLLREDPYDFRIASLAPGAKATRWYRERMDRPTIRRDPARLAGLHHNRISSVIGIDFGGWCAVLARMLRESAEPTTPIPSARVERAAA